MNENFPTKKKNEQDEKEEKREGRKERKKGGGLKNNNKIKKMKLPCSFFCPTGRSEICNTAWERDESAFAPVDPEIKINKKKTNKEDEGRNKRERKTKRDIERKEKEDKKKYIPVLLTLRASSIVIMN